MMRESCPVCGAILPPGAPPERCPACGEPLPPAGGPIIPFDAPLQRGIVRAFWETWRDALLRPSALFSRVPGSRAYGWPFLYAALWWLIAAAANAVQQPFFIRLLRSLPTRAQMRGQALETSSEAIALSLVAAPILGVASALLVAGVTHALLLLVGGARRGFVTSLRAVAYTYGVFAIWLVPLLGIVLWPLALPTWWWILLVIALSRAHDTEAWRSTFAVVLPGVCCYGLLGAAAMWLAAQLQQSMTQPP